MVAVLGALAAGCACSRSCLVTATQPLPRRSIPGELVQITVAHYAQQLNPLRPVQRMAGFGTQAVNAGEEALESSFLVEVDVPKLTPEQVRQGPTDPAHAAQPPFVVTKLKHEGKTSGFFATDAKGDRFLFKLDPPGFPELLTGAEVAAGKLLHALGYHVPSYEIVAAPLEAFSLGPKVHLTTEQFRALVADRLREGRLRVSASRLLDGQILGSIDFGRYRCCRELRALRLAYAWLNNTDAKDENSLLVRQQGQTLGYLIDFGTSLGADAARGAKRPCQGWLYDVDVADGLLEMVTLGRHRSTCETQDVFSPAVGRFTPALDPRRWKPYVPNLAFDAMTDEDAAWMADRLAQLTRPQLEAAVAAAQYSRPEDAAWVVEVLDARRRAITAAYDVDAQATP